MSTDTPLFASEPHLFPAVPAESPLSSQFDDTDLAVEGQVYSFTIMHPSPKSGLPPFVLAYVDLPGPVRLFGRLGKSPLPKGVSIDDVKEYREKFKKIKTLITMQIYLK